MWEGMYWWWRGFFWGFFHPFASQDQHYRRARWAFEERIYGGSNLYDCIYRDRSGDYRDFP